MKEYHSLKTKAEFDHAKQEHIREESRNQIRITDQLNRHGETTPPEGLDDIIDLLDDDASLDIAEILDDWFSDDDL